MKTTLRITLVLCWTVLTVVARAQTPKPDLETPRRAAASFFAYHLKDGVEFTTANIGERRPWFTAELFRLLQHEFERQRAFEKKHPDDVPFFDGDPFTNTQDFPNRVDVGAESRRGDTATVPVRLIFQPKARTITIRLKRENGRRWRIDDFVGGDGESLKKLLRRPRYESYNKPS